MKVKIKKTGEIINIAEYSKIQLECCDSWGNPIEVKPEDVEFIQEQTEDEHLQIDDITDWNYYRIHAAIAAMQAYIPENKGHYMICDSDRKYKDTAIEAIQYADALIEELKKK